MAMVRVFLMCTLSKVILCNYSRDNLRILWCFSSQTYMPLSWWICHSLHTSCPGYLRGQYRKALPLGNSSSPTLAWDEHSYLSFFPSTTKRAQTLGIAKCSWGKSHHNSLTVPHLSLHSSTTEVGQMEMTCFMQYTKLCPRAIMMNRKLYPSPKGT